MDWINNLKIGDTVLVEYDSFLVKGLEKKTVEKIAKDKKKPYLLIGEKKFDFDGKNINSDAYSRGPHLVEPTQENLDKLSHQNLSRRLKDHINFSTMTLDQLRRIYAIVTE